MTSELTLAAVELVPVADTETDDLVALLAGNRWPFHLDPAPGADRLRQRLAGGWLHAPGTETCWVLTERRRAGLLRLFDLDDGSPLFDLRLVAAERGRGVGTAVVGLLTDRVFSNYPRINRIEATTRADNLAMRAALRAAGWSKESHWRRSWPDLSGVLHDGVGYGRLRSDWQDGTVTAVDWHDEPA